jgi:hypothetical protein
MESTLIDILILVILASILYCVALALGVDPGATIEAAQPWVYLLLAIPAVYVAVRVARYLRERSELRPGDHVIYNKLKFSGHPGPRAENVHPAARGEGYSYVVRKPWTVVDIEDDDTVEVVTPGGKHHVLEADDPNLHRAGLLETLAMRLRWHKSFPSSDA